MQSQSGAVVVLGSSMSGLLMSQSLSRAGIDHVMIGGDPPPAIPRLGESLNDTASPEIWRFYGRELPECFAYKNHIIYFNGNFSTMIHLANPRRTKADVASYAPVEGVPSYPWFGDGLFHIDRIAFDEAIYKKVRADERCRFLHARVKNLAYDASGDRISRIDLDDGSSIESPRYVFDNTGANSLVANAANVGQRIISTPQRVVFTHFRRADVQVMPPEFWRHGTNLIRLDREFDGIDAIAWVIAIGRTLSVGFSIDVEGPRGGDDKDELMERLERACYRRGLKFREAFPEKVPVQELRHQYFVRDRAYGKNWLLVGGTYMAIWFPSSAGMATVTAAATLAPRLLDEPELGAQYEKALSGLLPFHQLLDGVIHGPTWKTSLGVYKFFSRGSAFILGRISRYLRIKNHRFGWFAPTNWFLDTLALVGRFLPTLLFLLMGGMALVRTRLSPDRRRQADPFPLYFYVTPFRVVNFVRSIPYFLWALIPRRTQLSAESSVASATALTSESPPDPPREAAA